MICLYNGAVYKRNIWVFVLISFGYDNWGMLHIHRNSRDDKLSAPVFQHDDTGRFIFTMSELKRDWDMENWIMLDGRLRIEKIDPEMRLTDLIIGGTLKECKI